MTSNDPYFPRYSVFGAMLVIGKFVQYFAWKGLKHHYKNRETIEYSETDGEVTPQTRQSFVHACNHTRAYFLTIKINPF